MIEPTRVERGIQTATELAALVLVFTMAGRQLQLNMGEQMKTTKMVLLGIAAFVIGMSLGACHSSTAPAAPSISGSWDGIATAYDSVHTKTSLHLILVEQTNGTVTGSGTWGVNASAVPFTVIDGMQENVAYAGSSVSNVSLRVQSVTLGTADLNGALAGGQFTGSIRWGAGPPYSVTLAR